jgi:hypothetical protein
VWDVAYPEKTPLRKAFFLFRVVASDDPSHNDHADGFTPPPIVRRIGTMSWGPAGHGVRSVVTDEFGPLSDVVPFRDDYAASPLIRIAAAMAAEGMFA